MEKKVLYSWSAGIIDGEGHIALCKHHHNQRRPVVEVGNTDYKIVGKLKEYFGGNISLNGRNPNERICWKWYLRGRKVISFLEKISPFLISKKEKAKIVLEYAHTIGIKPIDKRYRNDLVEQLNTIK